MILILSYKNTSHYYLGNNCSAIYVKYSIFKKARDWILTVFLYLLPKTCKTGNSLIFF